MIAILSLMLIQSTVFAGAAFNEITHCSEVNVDFAGQFEIKVSNSLSDGYSHEIKLTKNRLTKNIGSVNTTDGNYDGNATMETQYGKFSVEVDNKKGILTFDGVATINPTDHQPVTLRKATLKIKAQKKQSLLCVVD